MTSKKNILRCKTGEPFYKALIFPLCNHSELNGVDALRTYHPNYYNLIVRSVTFFDLNVAQLELKLMEKDDYSRFVFVLTLGKKEITFDSNHYDIDQLALLYLSILHKWEYPYVGSILAKCPFKLQAPSIDRSYDYIMYNLILIPNKALLCREPSRCCRSSKDDFRIYSSISCLDLRNTKNRKRGDVDISFALNKYANGSLHRRNCKTTQCSECSVRFYKKFVCDDVANFLGQFIYVRKPQT